MSGHSSGVGPAMDSRVQSSSEAGRDGRGGADAGGGAEVRGAGREQATRDGHGGVDMDGPRRRREPRTVGSEGSRVEAGRELVGVADKG
jgi:hypothetical protein